MSYSVFAGKVEISEQGEKKTSMVVENNPLHTADYKELWNVYSSGARSCVHYTRFITTPMPTSYGRRKDAIASAKYNRKLCKEYVKHMPYTFEQVTDPRAINRYQLKSRLEDCKKYGKGLRKAANCDQLESQQ